MNVRGQLGGIVIQILWLRFIYNILLIFFHFETCFNNSYSDPLYLIWIIRYLSWFLYIFLLHFPNELCEKGGEMPCGLWYSVEIDKSINLCC